MVDLGSSSSDFNSANFGDKELLKVISAVAKNRASYPTEVSNHAHIDRTKASHILYLLHDAGILERLEPKQEAASNDHRLLSRREDLWSRGITSLENFKNMKWFALNSELEWCLKVQGEDFFVDEYHRKRIEEPDTSALDKIKQELSKDKSYGV